MSDRAAPPGGAGPEPRGAPERPVHDWLEANRRALDSALTRVRALLQAHVGRTVNQAGPPEVMVGPGPELPSDSGLGLVRDIFGLTPFETDLLALAAGVEVEGGFLALCAAATGDPGCTAPTFGLALAALPGGHWSALTPDAPLRRWRLVVPGGHGHLLLTRAPLRIDERILHFIVGLDTSEPELDGRVQPVPACPETLPPGHESLAERLRALWTGGSGPALVQLTGDPDSAGEVASRAAALAGLAARVLSSDDIPLDARDREELRVLLDRDGMLGAGALVLRDEGQVPASVQRWAATLTGPVVVTTPTRWDLPGGLALDVAPLTAEEQRAVWRGCLPALAAQRLDDLTAAFRLTAGTIRSAATESRACGADAWSAARSQSRLGLDGLAARVESTAGWDDLVLPEVATTLLREIHAQVRHRHTVYGTWGVGRGSSLRGPGVSALFAGPSGTGKTLAAEVLAGALDLDLHRVDLSQVVSKYIGETEKNLGQVFDAADRGGCVLLFDEADALFGKRSEVRDSHDRYANLEVSYLLQRMEAYRGLAMLTTNLRDNLDSAFLRRLDFVVPFTFPDAGERQRIWARILPPTVPTEGLRLEALARLAVPGGVIRNVAIGAAFLAADAGTPVRMAHLLRAAQRECVKLERPLSLAEVGDWV